MSDFRDLLLDSVTRMMSEHCTPDAVAAAESEWPQALWQLVEEAGLPLAAAPAEAGGGGAGATDALAVSRLAARYACPLPLGETSLLAAPLLAAAGLPLPGGPLAAAWHGIKVRPNGDRRVLEGRAARVPWARQAARIAVLAEGPDGPEVCSVDPATCGLDHAVNLAGEPRDTVTFDGVVVAAGDHGPAGESLRAPQLDGWAALLRAAQIAAALTTATTLSVTYAGERVQFGRPIARFQAVGQQLALLAAESAAANAAVDLATAAIEAGRDGTPEIAAAKVRAGQAAGVGAEIAHQVHGAIGTTREHRLHHVTRRLWSWREEYGSETVWAQRLGEQALAAGGGGLWPMVTDTTRH